MSFIEFIKIIWDLSKERSLLLDPITTLFQHSLLDVISLNLFYLIFQLFLLSNELFPMGLLDCFSIGPSIDGILDWIILDLILSLWFPLHSKEDHLFLSHLLNLFSGQDSTNVALNQLCRFIFSLLCTGLDHVSIVHFLSCVNIRQLFVDFVHEVQVTVTTLTTTLIFLDKSDGMDVWNIESIWIKNNFIYRVLVVKCLFELLINMHLFLSKRWVNFWWGIIICLLLFTFFLTSLLFSFLLLTSFSFDFLLKDDIYWDLIILLKVAWDWDLNHRWVILQIKEKSIQMDIDRASSVVEMNKEFLHLTNSANSALKNLFDKDSLLWVHNLIIALFEFAVNLNILDIKNSIMRPSFFNTPELTILLK